MSPNNQLADRCAEVIELLCDMDKDLLLGTCEGWGSWMFDSASYMVSLGLGSGRNGSITFDTPLAMAVIAALRARQS